MAFDPRNRENFSAGVDVLDPPTVGRLPVEAPIVTRVSVRPARSRPTPVVSLDRATNTHLVERANEGDRRAWEALVDRYAGLVESVGVRHRLDRHDINDVSQITWLRLTQHLGRLDDPERVGLWLHTAARRECQALLQRSGRMTPTDVAEEFDDEQEQPEELIGRAERAHHLRCALSRLPDACRTLLELMLVQDPPAPYAEISQRCEIAVGTIGPRRKRCLAHLRRLYEQVFPDSDSETEGR